MRFSGCRDRINELETFQAGRKRGPKLWDWRIEVFSGAESTSQKMVGVSASDFWLE
jgi:hypothetical protein